MHGKTEWVAGGVDIDLEQVSCLQYHDCDACEHGDLLPTPYLGMVMDLLEAQAMHSVDLERENSAGTNASPMQTWYRGQDEKIQSVILYRSVKWGSCWYHLRVQRTGMRGAFERVPSPVMRCVRAVALRATLVGQQKIVGVEILAALFAVVG